MCCADSSNGLKMDHEVLDPVGIGIQATKALTECQVTYNIEGSAIKPRKNIYRSFLTILFEFFHQEIDIFHDNRLLLAKSLIRKLQ